MIKRRATGAMSRMLKARDEKSYNRTRNKMIIAARIADAIEAKGLSQKQVAEQMGKPESEVSEWLSGDRNFTIDTLTDIEVFLGIKLLNTHLVHMQAISGDKLSIKVGTSVSTMLYAGNWTGARFKNSNSVTSLIAG